jgi:hypothetical protein
MKIDLKYCQTLTLKQKSPKPNNKKSYNPLSWILSCNLSCDLLLSAPEENIKPIVRSSSLLDLPDSVGFSDERMKELAKIELGLKQDLSLSQDTLMRKFEPRIRENESNIKRLDSWKPLDLNADQDKTKNVYDSIFQPKKETKLPNTPVQAPAPEREAPKVVSPQKEPVVTKLPPPPKTKKPLAIITDPNVVPKTITPTVEKTAPVGKPALPTPPVVQPLPPVKEVKTTLTPVVTKPIPTPPPTPVVKPTTPTPPVVTKPLTPITTPMVKPLPVTPVVMDTKKALPTPTPTPVVKPTLTPVLLQPTILQPTILQPTPVNSDLKNLKYIPLKLVISESVNSIFKDNELVNYKLNGQISAKMNDSTTYTSNENIKFTLTLKNTKLLENLVNNKSYSTKDEKNEFKYTFDLPIEKFGKKLDQEVVLLKYNLSPDFKPIPIRIIVNKQIKENAIQMIVKYKINPNTPLSK